MRNSPFLAGRQFGRLRLEKSNIERSKIHGIEDPVSVPVGADIGSKLRIVDAFHGQIMNQGRCRSPIPGRIKFGARFGKKAVVIE